jgi:signal transduction histidine kinase
MRDDLQTALPSPSDTRPNPSSEVGEIALTDLIHDLSSPLDAASRFVRIARRALRDGDIASIGNALSFAESGLQRAGETVGAARNRLIAGGDVKTLQSTETVLQRAISAAEQRAGRFGVTIFTDVGADLPMVRAGNLISVFCNIIENGIDAMPAGGRLQVQATVDASNDPFVVITVTDEGLGAPPEMLDQIFEPYVTTKSAEGGMGLGLHICRRIVEEAEGQIFAEARAEGGIRIVVRLPAHSGAVIKGEVDHASR